MHFEVLPEPSSEDEILTITPPTFAPVYVGYAQPDPMPITITNPGNRDVRIMGLVKTSGDDFTISRNDSSKDIVVPAGGTDSSYMIQPNVGWGVGNHTAVLTLMYGNNQTTTVIVHFVVQPRPSSGDNSSDSSDDSDSSESSGSWSVPADTWVRDQIGWWYRKTDGTYPVSCWQRLAYQNMVEWYHFDERGYMQTGWFTDAAGRTYYLHAVSDGRQGYMYTGWHQIDSIWYYFREVQDGTEGALYKNTYTSDGYWVDENGMWKT